MKLSCQKRFSLVDPDGQSKPLDIDDTVRDVFWKYRVVRSSLTQLFVSFSFSFSGIAYLFWIEYRAVLETHRSRTSLR